MAVAAPTARQARRRSSQTPASAGNSYHQRRERERHPGCPPVAALQSDEPHRQQREEVVVDLAVEQRGDGVDAEDDPPDDERAVEGSEPDAARLDDPDEQDGRGDPDADRHQCVDGEPDLPAERGEREERHHRHRRVEVAIGRQPFRGDGVEVLARDGGLGRDAVDPEVDPEQVGLGDRHVAEQADPEQDTHPQDRPRPGPGVDRRVRTHTRFSQGPHLGAAVRGDVRMRVGTGVRDGAVV